MRKYKWRTAMNWLNDKVYFDWSKKQLRATVMELAEKVGLDELADVFETDMRRDGYYLPTEEQVIRIEVRGGVAEVVDNPSPFEVIIRDFDNEKEPQHWEET